MKMIGIIDSVIYFHNGNELFLWEITIYDAKCTWKMNGVEIFREWEFMRAYRSSE